jgi:hypothetical protein
MRKTLDRWYSDDTFVINENHRKLAAHLNVTWSDDYEWGAVEFGDAKRPFGNGDLIGDIAEILDWDTPDEDEEWTAEQVATARRLHFEMGYVAKSLLAAFALTP